MPERDFKGVFIPASVWLDERLNALEKVILTEIDSLDGEKGCWAGNDYISQFCQCSASKVSKAVSKLIELGYVRVESFNGRKRVLRSCLAKNTRQSSRICEADEQNLPQSNIKNNIENKEKRKRFTPPTVDEVKAYCLERNNGIDPEAFTAFYASKGWKVGNSQMKDWKQAIITWEKREQREHPQQQKPKKREYREIRDENGEVVEVVWLK